MLIFMASETAAGDSSPSLAEQASETFARSEWGCRMTSERFDLQSDGQYWSFSINLFVPPVSRHFSASLRFPIHRKMRDRGTDPPGTAKGVTT
jgi:hypothetical protein